MTTVAVIPARYGSTRFPGKPLAKDTGKYLIQHVVECVCQSRRIDRTIVATDDERVAAAVKSFGGDVMMTRPDHRSGTERVAEVAAALGLDGNDLVLNVQGDEPEIPCEALDELIERMESDACPIGTLAASFDENGPKSGPGSPADPNCVKIVVDDCRRALYFSRSLVPYPRATAGVVDRLSRWLLHLGVYAFRADVLAQIGSGKSVGADSLAETEALEQLGWLAAGWQVVVNIIDHRFVGVDTPEDYAAFVKRNRVLQREASGTH